VARTGVEHLDRPLPERGLLLQPGGQERAADNDETAGEKCGQGRSRTADLPLFRSLECRNRGLLPSALAGVGRLPRGAAVATCCCTDCYTARPASRMFQPLLQRRLSTGVASRRICCNSRPSLCVARYQLAAAPAADPCGRLIVSGSIPRCRRRSASQAARSLNLLISAR
jgi:hypothetical protein